LEKDRWVRYQHASDLRAELKRLQRGSAPSEVTKATSRPWWRALAAGVAAFTVAALGWYWLGRQEGETSLQNATFTQLTDQPGQELFPSLSPDGKSFLYQSRPSGNWDIYLQRVGGKNPINLTKDTPVDDMQPAFSPDSERIAFRSDREGGGIFV